MRITGAFISDSRHRQLIRAIVAADRDTDKITMALGEIGNIWPDCCRRDLERDEAPAQAARTKSKRKARGLNVG